MPKLVYFELQGRAQAIRYLLAYKGIEYEDVKLSFEQWGQAKAAGTYGEGNLLPVWVAEDGTIFNQSRAILEFLAYENGVVPTTAVETFEKNWYFEVRLDHDKSEGGPAKF